MKKKFFVLFTAVLIALSFSGGAISASGPDGGATTLELPSVH
ncbi:hypothetical protein [Bacillus mesophilum]|nr:hypothetical protein [Bacillus mesophilum]